MKVLAFDNPGKQYHFAKLTKGIESCGDTFSQVPAHYLSSVSELEDVVNREHPQVAIFIGMNKNLRRYRDFMLARGIVPLILEQGHIGDRKENPQFSIGDLNWITKTKCPDDRLRKILGIPKSIIFDGIDPRKEDGKYILVLGQKDGDSQHGISNITTWAEATLMYLRRNNFFFQKIVFRPHPFASTRPKGYDEIHETDPRELNGGKSAYRKAITFSLEKSFKGASFCVTHNSNAGIKALLLGIKVVSDPCAIYHGAGNLEPDKFMDIFSRIAYSQWNGNEMESGEAWEWMKGAIERENLFNN